MSTIRIVLADDHPVIRASLRRMLDKSAGLEVVGEAGNGHQVLRLIEKLNPDMLVLDIEMPGMNGLEVARRLKGIASPVKILALSAYDDKHYILGMLSQGVDGYVTKEEAPEIIVQMIHKIANGERGIISERIATLLKGRLGREGQRGRRVKVY